MSKSGNIAGNVAEVGGTYLGRHWTGPTFSDKKTAPVLAPARPGWKRFDLLVRPN